MPAKDVNQIKTICVLRLSAIGDVCNASAIVQEFQRQWPHVALTWIIGKTEYAALKNLHGIEFIIFDKSAGLAELVRLYRQLKRRHFDVLLHMQSALRASLVSICVHATVKVGFDRARAREGQWLFTNRQIAPQAEPHVLEGFKAFALALGLKEFTPKWDIPIDPDAEHWARIITCKRPYILLSASASNTERNWSQDYYCEIVRYLTGRGFTVVLTCGRNQDEVNLAKHIYIETGRKVINVAGSTSLQELMALIKGANFVISPDSGPAHIANMFDVPIIGLYAHSNPKRTGPWRSRELVVSHYESNILKQKGLPANRLPWGTRAKGKELMRDIKPDEVIARIKHLLKLQA